MTRINYAFDGGESDNTELHDPLTYAEQVTLYCRDCEKPVGKALIVLSETIAMTTLECTTDERLAVMNGENLDTYRERKALRQEIASVSTQYIDRHPNLGLL